MRKAKVKERRTKIRKDSDALRQMKKAHEPSRQKQKTK